MPDPNPFFSAGNAPAPTPSPAPQSVASTPQQRASKMGFAVAAAAACTRVGWRALKGTKNFIVSSPWAPLALGVAAFGADYIANRYTLDTNGHYLPAAYVEMGLNMVLGLGIGSLVQKKILQPLHNKATHSKAIKWGIGMGGVALAAVAITPTALDYGTDPGFGYGNTRFHLPFNDRYLEQFGAHHDPRFDMVGKTIRIVIPQGFNNVVIYNWRAEQASAVPAVGGEKFCVKGMASIVDGDQSAYELYRPIHVPGQATYLQQVKKDNVRPETYEAVPGDKMCDEVNDLLAAHIVPKTLEPGQPLTPTALPAAVAPPARVPPAARQPALPPAGRPGWYRGSAQHP